MLSIRRSWIADIGPTLRPDSRARAASEPHDRGQTGAVGRRRIIGIAGCPGAGKSTLAAGLVAEHPDTHVLVPMDGFHLADEQLRRLGRADRKGGNLLEW